MKKMETSKKLLWIVVAVWILTTVSTYGLGYYGVNIPVLDNTYDQVTNVFLVELFVYSGKSGVENFNKIKNSVDSKIQEKFKNMI